jgi:hypothetical protein
MENYRCVRYERLVHVLIKAVHGFVDRISTQRIVKDGEIGLLLAFVEFTLARRVRNVSAFAVKDELFCVGRWTVTISSTIVVGVPMSAENSRSRLYTVHHRMLQRVANSTSMTSSGIWRLIPSIYESRKAWPIWSTLGHISKEMVDARRTY